MNRSGHEFVEKLYTILEDPLNSKIIRWNDDGESFLLLDSILFTKNTLQQYFKHKNLNSFIRQLNKYDFHKIKSTEEVISKYGEEVWEFKHPYFKLRRKDLIVRIQRKKSTAEKKGEYADINTDVAEKSILLQNQMLHTLKQLSSHFQDLTQDIVELKKIVFNEKAFFNFSGYYALIYEENLNTKSFILNTLRKTGLTVCCAETPADINIYMEERYFNLIILSANLRNCIQTIINIRKNYGDVIVVITGTNFDRNDFLEFQRVGVDDVLIKPFNDNTFMKVLKKMQNKKTKEEVDLDPTVERKNYIC